MKLAKIEVKNFRSFSEPAVLSISEGMNALVGPNNSGKSNLVRAMRMALDPEYEFNPIEDVPGQRLFAYPRTTLTFQCAGDTSKERTLLKYLEEYERSVVPDAAWTSASKGIVRLVVTYRGTQNSITRQEYFAARGGGDRRGESELNLRAIVQFRKIVKFVAIESGQSQQELLAGKFREILSQVLQEEMRSKFTASEAARSAYIETLKTDLLGPMRSRVLQITGRLFPELSDVTLMPAVADLSETLSNVSIFIRDSVETALKNKGTGVAGGVLVALLRYLTDTTKESLVFALEEPEAFLHPGAQISLRRDLEGLTERKGVNLLVTTHSPYIISRSLRAQVVAVKKDSDGCSSIADTAVGNEDHAKVISGLFLDNVIPDLLDRYSSIPAAAQALLIVEGETDKKFLQFAMDRLGYDEKLRAIHVIQSTGVDAVVAQAVLLRAEASQPVWVLVDSDENGRNGRNALKRFKFDKNDVFEYGKFVSGHGEGAEAEWMFASPLMQRFVDDLGEEIVLKSKSHRGADWRYDFTPVGKEHFPSWLESNAKDSDFEGWIPVLEELARKLSFLS